MASRLHARRRARARRAAVVALVCASFFLLGPTSTASASLQPLATNILVASEDFEGAFPGTTWTVNDTDPGNGTDTWGPSGYRSFAGAGSAWSSAVGTQRLFWKASGSGNGTSPSDPFSDDFENASLAPAWNVTDNDPNDGLDYWGLSTFRAHNGTSSLWCAQVGYNNYSSDTNANVHLYDNNMDALIWRDINLAPLAAVNASSASLDFWYFVASEQGADFLDAVYFDGTSWAALSSFSGDSAGWQQGSANIPLTATRIGFRFQSDAGGILEGAYIDDIVVHAEHDEPNNALHAYDVDQNSTMTRAVDVKAFATASLQYRYFLDAQAPNDTLSVMVFAGGVWNYTDTRTGSSGGWQLATVPLPTSATRFGFRFLSNASGTREGAYLDDVKVYGQPFALACAANVSATVGYEGLSPFNFSGSTTGGLPPLTWVWNFTDTAFAFGQNASHTFANYGTYNVSLNVTDAAGQSCTAAAPPVTAARDTTSVGVAPTSAALIEGDNVSLTGADARGRPLALNWSVSPALCGAFSAPSGAAVTFTTSRDAGGEACTVRGAYGAVNATANVIVSHDLSSVVLTPTSAVVVEGASVALRATDANGHPLNFTWSATCGLIFPVLGPSALFNSSGQGGSVCRVTARLTNVGGAANITVLQDTSALSVQPAALAMPEGSTRELTSFDTFGHPVTVAWSVAPASCGAFSAQLANDTVFSASNDSGGFACTITGLVGNDSTAVHVSVAHDTNYLNIAPNATQVEEGQGVTLGMSDTYGHPYNATWSVAPRPCGSVAPATGGSTTFTASPDAGGLSCTVTAASGSLSWRGVVNVTHGAPASVSVSPAESSVVEGHSVDLQASALDARGHAVPGFNFTWSSHCANLSNETANPVTAATNLSDGGVNCTVRATYGGFFADAVVHVLHEGPYTVTLEPASSGLAGGGAQPIRAIVVDGHGLPVEGASVNWTASCGALSADKGPSVVFTAPSDLGGASCTVSASYADGAAVAAGSGTFSAGMSILVPLVAVAAAAVGAVLFLRWRKNRPPPPPKAEPAEAKIEVEIR